MSFVTVGRQMGSTDPLHIPAAAWWMAFGAAGISTALAVSPQLAGDAMLILRIAMLYLANHQG